MSSARQRSTANGTHTQEGQRSRLLIADDQPAILDALEILLRPEGYRLDRAASPRQLIECLASETYDAVLMDMNYTRDTTSGAEGIDLLAEIQSYGLRVPIIVMTAWSSVELAVEAMRRGAATSSRSRGTMRACSPCCARSSICIAYSARRTCWRRRTASCAPRVFPR